MSVNAIQATTSSTNQNLIGTSSVYNSQTSNQFMLMLLAQLKNQNPMDPMDDQAMLTQMTQLNSLQLLQQIQNSMQQLAISNQATNAASLIGKYVKAAMSDGSTYEGTVSEVDLSQGNVMVTVGNHTVPFSNVTMIKDGDDN